MIMLEANQVYVVIKLISGEQLMGVCTEETDKDITIMFPMSMKQYPIQRPDGSVGETITGNPFCQFSNDRTFIIPKSSVMINKPLHALLIPFYVRMVNQFEKVLEVPESMFEDDNPEEEEHELLSIEKVEKAVDRLTAIMFGTKKEDELNIDGTFIDGNDTIH